MMPRLSEKMEPLGFAKSETRGAQEATASDRDLRAWHCGPPD
jgi:hypothetical protein